MTKTTIQRTNELNLETRNLFRDLKDQIADGEQQAILRALQHLCERVNQLIALAAPPTRAT